MLIHIFGISRFLSKNVCLYNFKRVPFFPGNSRFMFFSNNARIDDVSDRFRHVASSSSDSSCQIDDNLYFQPDTSSEETPNHTTDDRSLDTYSLENVESAVMQFVPEYISSVRGRENPMFMTPGQAFFLENKDKLMETIRRRYYEEKRLNRDKLDDPDQDEGTLLSLLDHDLSEESFGSYGSDHFPGKKKPHLWDYNSTSVSIKREPIELTKGVMPTIDQIVQILEQEGLTDLTVMDMNKYERRDQGLYVILASGTTSSHCRLDCCLIFSRRVGRLLYNIITDLEIPFVSKVSYCCKSRSDEWIISHLGPLSVHLMVKEIRSKYSLEEFWSEHLSTRRELSSDLLPH